MSEPTRGSRRRLVQYLVLLVCVVVGCVLLARGQDAWAWAAFGAAAGGVIAVAQSRRKEGGDR
ncbi:hypothetical protein [Kineococcus rhizosphaerae]|uniref:Uncharacterized protein n=1 Tax=Kineococcus rhizosphaerae TaxID=559628 RepID=A0A2T0QXK6_9ACTN|nr:hypothetical protein [Kineococcus rhizosphaerae]PRY10759.1 hypothetical protein CLV37_11523 [Kineococcus rhizosphaerae]